MDTIVFERSLAEKRGSHLPCVDYFALDSAGFDGTRAEWDS